MKNNPLVSIIMATYNRSNFILESLLTIQNQTYQNWECLIIDDGGTDNTKEVIEPLLSKDSRFKFLKRPSKYIKGLSGCRNFGLDTVKGDYIIFFDDDDIVHPDNLLLCVKEISKGDLDFCRYHRSTFHGDFDYNFDRNDQYSSFKISKKDISKVVDHSLPFNSCAVLWKSSCFENHRFVEDLFYAEEWELYTRIILFKDLKGISIDKTLFYGRKHSKSNTGEFIESNPTRRISMNKAIIHIASNLIKENAFNDHVKNYLANLLITYRDKEYFKKYLKTINIGFYESLKFRFKFDFYPIWSSYKLLLKKK